MTKSKIAIPENFENTTKLALVDIFSGMDIPTSESQYTVKTDLEKIDGYAKQFAYAMSEIPKYRWTKYEVRLSQVRKVFSKKTLAEVVAIVDQTFPAINQNRAQFIEEQRIMRASQKGFTTDQGGLIP